MDGGNHVRMTPNDGTTMALTTNMVAHKSNDNFVASAAVDLIHQLDAAFAEMNSCIIADARDAEEARKNARVASELARRFSSGNFLTHLNTEQWTEEISVFPKQQKAPPRPASMYNQNGASTTATPVFSSPQRTPAAGSTDPPSAGAARSSSKRLNRTAERLAVAHAEDLLQVSLELERTKQALESEQMNHDESKSALHQAKQKNAQLEAQIEKLLQDMETAREESGRKVDALEDDLRRAKDRIQTAEYEATMATDICIQADEQREEKERLLQRALEEINLLKEHIASSHSAGDLQSYLHDHGPGYGMEEEKSEDGRHRRVRFEDEVIAPSEAETYKAAARPSRALVAAGRQLLYRSLSADGEAFVSHHSAEASTARRHRLHNRLQTLDVDLDFDLKLPKGDRHSRDMSSAVEALDVCRNAARILKESGKRLSLTGRWFNGQASTVTDEIHLETLAKHYTTLVEVQLDRKYKDVLELESLISLWEEGISMKRGASTDVEQELNP